MENKKVVVEVTAGDFAKRMGLSEDMILRGLQYNGMNGGQFVFSKKKEGVINVYRYIRVSDKRNYYEMDPCRGATVRFQIDFDKRTIKANFSLCNIDTFNKKEGRRIADEAFKNATYEFAMPDDSHWQDSLLTQFVKHLQTKEVKSSMERRLIKMFYEKY